MPSASSASQQHFHGRLARTLVLFLLLVSVAPLLLVGIVAAVHLYSRFGGFSWNGEPSQQIILSIPLKAFGLLVILWLGLLSLLTIAVLRFIRQRLVHPMNALAELMQLFALGNWELRAWIDRDDEIGLLSYSFNMMAEDLTGYFHSLETRYADKAAQVKALDKALEKEREKQRKRLQPTAAGADDQVTELILQAMEAFSQAVATSTDLQSLFNIFHEQISSIMGKTNFLIALYDVQSNLIHIPYMTEGSTIIDVPPYPFGEGLVSEVIRSKQPLLLAEDVENKAAAFKSKVIGATARSWLGVPLIAGNEIIGAVAVQDTEQEGRFNLADQRLLSTLAPQIAISVRNTHLVEIAQQHAERERIVADITRAVWASSDIETIVRTALYKLGQSMKASEGLIQLEVQE